MAYEHTWLWRRAFVDPRIDAPRDEQRYFQERYLAMREKAAALVSRIGADMPAMTVHDVSHLDSLWEMASILSFDAVELNPPEAFVFGGAVLLHDAAMSLAAYPGGMEGLKKDIAWRDSFARLMQIQDRSPEEVDLPTVEALATAEVLRGLHAQQAEKLATMPWFSSSSDTEFLIDDPNARNFYGPKIGQIASSHWWSVAKVEEKLANDLGPLGGFTGNRIDLIKIACLLRAADAIHLDRRRAPGFLRKLLNPAGISASHWDFQERMAVPFIEADALVYSAAPPFTLNVADAWWLAFDAVVTVDKELRDIDHLLQERKKGRLKANRVKGAASPTALSHHITTIGWVPVDSTVRVSDVPKIVSTLGGSKLYGNDPTAALRELIQNAADAVDARRRLEGRNVEWGTITVTLEMRSDEHWLVIEDSGIGMSPRVLTGPLIDFGNSFWRSPLAAEEFPGLQASGLNATGRYGIGFFSVFMLGSIVRVTSRRPDKGADTVRTLEFRNGLASRPILYVPDLKLSPIDGGTRIEVRLHTNPQEKGGLLYDDEYRTSAKKLRHLVPSLAPSLGVRLVVVDGQRRDITVNPEDWKTIAEPAFLARLAASTIDRKKKSKAKDSRLRLLIGPGGEVYGRAMIDPEVWRPASTGCVTVGGLRASNIAAINGILMGKELTASRNQAFPIAPASILSKWASEQATLIAKAEMDWDDKARAAQIVLSFGGSVGELPIARWGGEWLTSEQLSTKLSSLKRVSVFFEGRVSYDGDWDDCHPREFSDFVDDPNVIFVPADNPGLGKVQLDRNDIGHVNPRNLQDLFRQLVDDCWGSETTEDDDFDVVVGSVYANKITRVATIFEAP